LDGISIWGTTDKPFVQLLPEVKDMFNMIIAAVAFKTKKPLTYELENWIEAREVVATKNMIGFLYPAIRPLAPPLPERSPTNTPWKKAVWLFQNLSKGNGNHVLALKDFHSALLDAGPDSFLFAYRAIEDICRAVTNVDEMTKSAWSQMHQTLGTSKAQIESLKKVADKVRHGNRDHSLVTQEMPNRSVLIDTAHKVIAAELRRTFPRF